MTYTCPVCGYNKLEDLPTRFEICPSCGTEFGNHDELYTREELRHRWIAGGGKWWSEHDETPNNWSPVTQLRNIGYEAIDTDRLAMANIEKITFGKLEPTRPFVIFPASTSIGTAIPAIAFHWRTYVFISGSLVGTFASGQQKKFQREAA